MRTAGQRVPPAHLVPSSPDRSIEELDEAIEGEVEVEGFSRLIRSATNLLRFRISDVSVATTVEDDPRSS